MLTFALKSCPPLSLILGPPYQIIWVWTKFRLGINEKKKKSKSIKQITNRNNFRNQSIKFLIPQVWHEERNKSPTKYGHVNIDHKKDFLQYSYMCKNLMNTDKH